MNSTINWLRRHRLATFSATAALTALMVAPELADAGHRRHHRSRHCCCGSSYGYSGHSYGHGGYSGGHHGYYSGHSGKSYSYGHGGYASGNRGWSTQGYADSGTRYHDSRLQADSNIRQGERVIQSDQYQSDQSQPRNLPQGDRITSNRPNLDEGVPPAPGQDGRANADRDARMQDGAQQTEQLRQRVQTLEQENERLKQQLEEARGNENNAPAEPRNQSPQDNQTGAEAEATSDTETDAAELPAPPEADAEADADAAADAEDDSEE